MTVRFSARCAAFFSFLISVAPAAHAQTAPKIDGIYSRGSETATACYPSILPGLNPGRRVPAYADLTSEGGTLVNRTRSIAVLFSEPVRLLSSGAISVEPNAGVELPGHTVTVTPEFPWTDAGRLVTVAFAGDLPLWTPSLDVPGAGQYLFSLVFSRDDIKSAATGLSLASLRYQVAGQTYLEFLPTEFANVSHVSFSFRSLVAAHPYFLSRDAGGHACLISKELFDADYVGSFGTSLGNPEHISHFDHDCNGIHNSVDFMVFRSMSASHGCF
jgi:hypothetical protein